MSNSGDDESPFDLDEQPDWVPSSPRELFAELTVTASDVKHLWEHQGAVLESYTEYEEENDIAIELPTGMGKTLVGFLLAEYRRMAHANRVAYLCPTRQLAQQALSQASGYGIDARLLIGPQADYPPADYAAYASGNAVAVTTYAGVFNSNPRIDDAQCLVLDDAHSGSDFMSDMWSVRIPRSSQCYQGVVDLLSDAIPYSHLSLFRNSGADPYRRQTTFKIPGPAVTDRSRSLLEYLDEHLPSDQTYAWGLTRDHLAAVHIYLSWHKILLCPLIPPTERHPPVADAEQRIYMSATLGEGGELERSTGIQEMVRIPVPEGWESQRTGRRFITLPDYSLESAEAGEYVVEAIREQPRSLVLCPTRWLADRLRSTLQEESDVRILDAVAVEESMAPFTESEDAVLLLAGRYDGIDLPDRSCRQIVVAGLPKALNLQEKFFFDCLRTEKVFRDRVRTRLVQGMGRCTRNPNDYAAVILWGTDLLDFCVRDENRQGMPAELQAELEFGIQNSDVDAGDELIERLRVFLAQDQDWESADAQIRRRRRDREKRRDEFSETLGAIAPSEVQFGYALWDGSYEYALELARGITDQLSGNEFANYRGWWHYLTAYAEYLLSDRTRTEVFRNQVRRAEVAGRVSWLRSLPRFVGGSTEAADEVGVLQAAAAENIAEKLLDLGFAGPRFERFAAQFETFVQSSDSDPFEAGLQQLGALLGFDAKRPPEDAMPDSVWTLRGEIGIALEAKNEVTVSPERGISPSTARQCHGHHETLGEWEGLRPDATRVVCVLHPLDMITEDARRVASDETCWVSLSLIRELASEAISAARRIRARCESEADIVEVALGEQDNFGLSPERILERLTETRLVELSLSQT